VKIFLLFILFVFDFSPLEMAPMDQNGETHQMEEEHTIFQVHKISSTCCLKYHLLNATTVPLFNHMLHDSPRKQHPSHTPHWFCCSLSFCSFFGTHTHTHCYKAFSLERFIHSVIGIDRWTHIDHTMYKPFQR
jgi:hypothetical protein